MPLKSDIYFNYLRDQLICEVNNQAIKIDFSDPLAHKYHVI